MLPEITPDVEDVSPKSVSRFKGLASSAFCAKEVVEICGTKRLKSKSVMIENCFVLIIKHNYSYQILKLRRAISATQIAPES